MFPINNNILRTAIIGGVVIALMLAAYAFASSNVVLYDVISGPTGTAFNDLLIGTSGNDILDGGDGSDCLVGGAGDDTCIGTPDDVFVGCETISPP